MHVWSIASGSSGNAYLLRSENTTLLVECGIPLGRIRAFLKQQGISPYDLDGILLTHDHTDHTRSARQLSDAYRVPIYATAGTFRHTLLKDAEHARPLIAGRTHELGDVAVLPFSVPHDAIEPVGFKIAGHAATVTVTTDLGHVPVEVQRQLSDNDLLIFEANHDVDMLQAGPYPYFLKRRVLGEHGHLSNRATAEALASCKDRIAPEIWLAHLSPTNNLPHLAQAVISEHLASRDLGHVAVRVAERHRPSLSWEATPRARQLMMF
ncbi:MAG: MBL fold metallo-hydrolase [Chloroflexi bacterium]|nr:MBL fold metallo-hydrolase [Chloroflexota bacterium]